MPISPVSFGSGLLYYKERYINPEQIVKFQPYDKDKKETRVIYNNSTNDIIKVEPEYFQAAFISAKNSNDVITLEKE